MELTALLQALVANTPHGLQIALAEINSTRDNKMSEQVLNNKLNPYYENDHLNEPQIEAIIRALNLYLPVAQHYATRANAVVFELPGTPECEGDFSVAFMDIARELGEVCAKYQHAIKDKRFCAQDFKKISKEIDGVVSAAARLKVIAKAGVL